MNCKTEKNLQGYVLYVVLLTSFLNKIFFMLLQSILHYDVLLFLVLLFPPLPRSLLYFEIIFICCQSKKTLHNLLFFSIDNIKKFIPKHIINYKEYCCFTIKDLQEFVLNIAAHKESGKW